VKPTRLMIFPHARGGPADRAALCYAALISPPGWVMHRRVLFARRSATRIPGQSRGLAGRAVLPSVLPRPAALLGFVPFAGLIPRPGGRDVSVRPGPRAVRADSSASRLIFVGMTGRRFDSQTCGSNRRSIVGQSGFDFWASTPVCGPSRHHRDGARRSCLGLHLLQG
jgi:hypothetical protein